MKTLILSLLTSAVALAAPAVNFSGKWAIQGASRGRSSTILVLNQVGQEVTGTIGARVDAGAGTPVNNEVLGGTVDGDTITFYVWTGRDQPVKTYYKGTMSGEETIAFTVTGGPTGGGFGGGGGEAGPRQVTAKRSK